MTTALRRTRLTLPTSTNSPPIYRISSPPIQPSTPWYSMPAVGRFGTLEQFSYEQIRSLIDLNLTSHVFVARAFLPSLKKAGRGHLIFMGSEAALTGTAQGSLYCAAKFALRGLAQALRAECARTSVRVTLVNPGMVQSPFFDELDFRPGPDPDNYILPEDVAEVIVQALTARDGTVLDEINLSPQKKVIEFGTRKKK